MSVIQVDVQLSTRDLLQAAEQLDANELNTLVNALIALKARRHAPVLPQTEAELLQEINQGLPAGLQARYTELIQKRQAERLMPSEHEELLGLTEQVEAVNVQRVAHLVKLAQLRGVALPKLMDDLGLDIPSYV
jgi:hypothetical protein